MKASAEAKQRTYEAQQARMAANRADVTARMLEHYRTEPDREYAETFWRPILEGRGALEKRQAPSA